MLKARIHREDTIAINTYVPNNTESTYANQKLKGAKRKRWKHK